MRSTEKPIVYVVKARRYRTREGRRRRRDSRENDEKHSHRRNVCFQAITTVLIAITLDTFMMMYRMTTMLTVDMTDQAMAESAFGRELASSTVKSRPNLTASIPMNLSTTMSKSGPNQTKPRRFTIFYNVFVPPFTRFPRRNKARNIILEQLEQIAEASKHTTSWVHLRFATIGSNLSTPIIMDECKRNNWECVHTSHYNRGWQEQTLKQIHPYCVAKTLDTESQSSSPAANKEDQIIYLHNKGSFHQEGKDGPNYIGQDNLRRSMTNAVLSRDCQEGLFDGVTRNKQKEKCNVCGLLFQPLPFHHFPGNIWTSTCDYILRLHSDWSTLEKKHQEVLQAIVDHNDPDQPQYESLLFDGSDSRVGAAQFLVDYWIGSHPRMRPCQVASSNDHSALQHWKDTKLSEAKTEFHLTAAPLAPIQSRVWDFYRYATRPWILNSTLLQSIDFYLLRGRLFQWKVMYNETPDSDSWVWSWYPGGRNVSSFDGTMNIDKPDDGQQQNAISAPWTESTTTGHSFPPIRRVTIFYNVFVPTLKGEPQRKTKAKLVIIDQLRQVAESAVVKQQYAKTLTSVQLRFVSIGSNETVSVVLSECRRHGLQCIHMGHSNSGMESLTLKHIHPLCAPGMDHEKNRRQTTSSHHQIIYMHNKGSYHQEDKDGPLFAGQDNWRRAMTDAATSDHCANGLMGGTNSTQHRCDVCGLLFQPMPYHHFPGNVWTTTCDYINRIHTWNVLEQKRQAMFDKMVQEGHYQTFYFPPVDNIVGADRYLAEYWIGSHPNMRPCDMATTRSQSSLQHWKDTPREQALQEFKLSNAPVMPIDDPSWEFHRYTAQPALLQNESARSVDFYLLPGSLFKWKELYNEIPSRDSFVWSWYPDGQMLYNQEYEGAAQNQSFYVNTSAAASSQ